MADDPNLQAQIQALTQQVAQLQAQQQQPQVQQPAQNPNIVGQFALTPAQATQDVIDLSSATGIKLYRTITAPLETKFDGSPNKLLSFLDDVEQRARRFAWNEALLSISNQDPVNPIRRNLLSHHRMIPMSDVTAHATGYIGTQTRLAQDASMMYEFLRDSLTEGARARLATDTTKYTVNGTRDGPCYLKTLLSKFYVETRATNFHLRQKMQHLPTTIADMSYNIASFNDRVRELVKDLASGGETSTDLIVYVFEAYLKVDDSVFNRYIERKKEAYDDGSEEVTVDALLDLALVKYNQIKQAGKWRSKTPEQEQIFALLSKLDNHTKQKFIEKDPKKNKGKDKTDGYKKKKGPRTPEKKKKGSPEKKLKLPPWRYVRTGQESTMVKDGKTWYWCDYHEFWCDHQTGDCRAKKRADKKLADNHAEETKDDGQAPQNPALSVARALAAITEGIECIEGLSDSDL